MASLISRLSSKLLAQSESANSPLQREGLRYAASSIGRIPETVATAKTDLFCLAKTISTGNFTGQQAKQGAAVAGQLIGLFALGVVVGRRSIFGYSVPPLVKDEKAKHH